MEINNCDEIKVMEKINNENSVICEGDISRLKNGLKVIDEKENIFEIETVAMTCFKDIKGGRKKSCVYGK